MVLVKQMQKRARDVRRRFLVAHLNKEGVVRVMMQHPLHVASACLAPCLSVLRLSLKLARRLRQAPALHDEADACMTNDLVDSRLSFLQKCIDRHWQFNELRRAHYSTMMLLAEIGGPA